MRKLVLLVLASTLTAVTGFAESFSERLERGHALLRSGDAEGALKAYRDLQTDEPESELLYYDMGCAQYQQALKALDINANEQAREEFASAEASLEKALLSPDAEVRKNAAYNKANTKAQLAKLAASGPDPQAAVAAFRDTVDSYDSFLKKYPDHVGARQNLEHIRYLLKTLLQNPPPPQEQQGDKNQQEGEKDKQDKEDQEKQPGDDESGQSKDEQQGQGQQKEEKRDEQQQAAQQKESEAGQDGQEDTDTAKADEDNTEPHQSVEAILQSLEDLDKREMQDAKDVPREFRTRKEWW